MGVVWSPTKIDYMNYCLMRYWLRYGEKEKPLRLSAYAKGGLLHDSIDKFWEKHAMIPEEIERVKRVEEAKKIGKNLSYEKKYYDREGFTNYIQGCWNKLAKGSDKAKIPIIWSYPNERWKINSVLSRVCPPLYDILHEEGPPSKNEISFREVPFEVSILDYNFKGRIDRIKNENGKTVIIDYKSGNPYMKEMKIDYDPQLTLYNLAVCSMAYHDEKFAKTLGLENKRHLYMGNPMYIDPEIEMQFFMIEALGLENPEVPVVHSSTRTDEHFFEIVDMIKKGEARIEHGLVYAERGRKCDSCDLKFSCKKKLKEVGREDIIEKTGQFLIQIASPLIIKKTKEEIKLEKKLAKQQQLTLKLRRDLKGYEERRKKQ